jgi:hypothetical protein
MRYAMNSPLIPMMTSPSSGISHAGGGSRGFGPPARAMKTNVMALPHSIKVKTSTIFFMEEFFLGGVCRQCSIAK